MRVAFVSSEVVPFAKTGGLADVSGALPRELAAQGAEVAVFTPYYRETHTGGMDVRETGTTVSVPLGEASVQGAWLRSVLPGSSVPVFLLRCDPFFDREGLYRTDGDDHPDNASRFLFFSRAVLEGLPSLFPRPDVIHANDWQTALIPVYAKSLYAGRDGLGAARTLLTIHNMGYQGIFWHWDMKLAGLPWELFHWKQLEFYGKLNFLKGGIVFADCLNTVSRTYAREIQTKAFGHGLEGALTERQADLHGVINGIDTDIWNPEADPHIPAPYSAVAMEGKAQCKEALLAEAGIEDDDRPLFASILRLDAQKGVDLLCDVIDDAVQLGMRFVLLGTGDPAYEELLRQAQARHPGKVKVFLTFSDAFAHRIEAGADALIMPSRYEPCGLNQLMSLRYGTVPVVRATGGLADTVVDFSEGNLAAGVSTGFTFRDPDSDGLLKAIARALRVYSNRRAWEKLQANGMGQDWSWRCSAAAYLDLYGSTLNRPPHDPSV